MSAKRTERGWPGHFCCVGRCRFRRNTLLEMGEERIVVSTVGNMTPFREDAVQPMQEIGLERCWETMVFKACYDDPYWEADVGNEVEFESPWALDATANDLDANAMHERVVAEMTERMQEAEGVASMPIADVRAEAKTWVREFTETCNAVLAGLLKLEEAK